MGKKQQLTLLLLSADDELAGFMKQLVAQPWNLAQHHNDYTLSDIFAHPNIKLIVFDDQNVTDGDRGWLLNRFRRHAPGASLIYVAGTHGEDVEKLARGGGAHYFVSKPVSPELFSYVLQSFMRSQGA